MTFDFDKLTTRRGSGSVKWDAQPDAEVLPLWVADMDFEAAPCIRRAIEERARHGVFGYVQMPEAYYDAVRNWFSRRHHWDIDRSHMLYTIGVVPAISCCIKALTMPGERVLVTSPVYNCFYSCIHNNGCEVAESPLRINARGMYEMDWDEFERQCANEKTRLFLLCNPHNPGGRIWSADELRRISTICQRHDVWVVSDEIHNELVMPGNHYTPYYTVTTDLDHSVALTSASKSFNIAGLQLASIVCANHDARRRIDRAININEVCDVNPFGVVATIAAYSDEGAEWLDGLNRYVQQNYELVRQFADRHPQFTLMPLEGTYLAWLNVSPLCQHLGINVEQLEQLLISEAKIYFNAGTLYGTAGEGFLRINMACQHSILTEALQRFNRFIAQHA